MNTNIDFRAKVFISGDIVNTQNKRPFISNDLQEIIQKQDFSICNFEAPIEGFGEKILKAGPSINQKKETIELLKNAGFNALLLANNHIYDYGKDALASTIETAKNLNLYTLGAGLNKLEAYKPLIKEINGLKIGIINACEAQFGVLDETYPAQESGYAWINHYLVDDAVKSTKKIVDKLIVCAHAGLEDYPVPLFEWKDRYRRLCDIGADCIVGSHPHIPQGYEIYNNKPIFYSLGNFYFDTASFENSPDYSFSVKLEITKEHIQFNLVYHHKENGMVRLTKKNEEFFDIDDLNKQLSSNKLLEHVYLDAYKKITTVFFVDTFSSLQFSTSVKQLIKNFVRKFFFSNRYRQKRETLLLHLNRNETYRWVTQNGIQLKIISKDQ
jgi:poly-gamma-glutamate capsule biosynthesis protein CapA/YwtB (metallophosphatase superfamily)